MRLFPLVLPLFALFPAAPVAAQTPERDAEADRLAAELRVEADMQTMGDLVEALAKNLGQMHWLRALCYGEGDQKWRDWAGRMIEFEAGGDGLKRSDLVRAFNAGYYQEQARHATCSPSVATDAAALAENGRSLSAMLGDPFRGE